MQTKVKVGLTGAALVAAALVYQAVTQTVAYPGYWRPGANGYYYQCNVVPYLVYPQPDTQKPTYVRYDYQVLAVTTNPLKLNQPAGQGANHDPQYTANDGRLIPVFSTNRPPGYMPYPTTLMLNPQWKQGDPAYQDAGAYYQSKNPGVPYVSPSELFYANSITQTGEWNDGNIPAFKQAKLQQCTAPPPPTKTVTMPPTLTAPPACPTCAATCAAASPTRTLTPHLGPNSTKTPTP